MSNATRFPNGLSTNSINTPMGDLPVPDPITIYQYFTDFNTYTAGDWTVVASTGTTALAAGVGGVAVQTTAATANDVQSNKLVQATGAVTPGYKAWFSTALMTSDISATAPAIITGFVAGTISGLAWANVTSGMYFKTNINTNSVDFVMNKAGVTYTLAGITTLASTTVQTQLSFYYDGKPTATIYLFVGSKIVARIVDSAAVPFATYLPTAALAIGWGTQNGAGAAAKTCTHDWLFAASETNRGV